MIKHEDIIKLKLKGQMKKETKQRKWRENKEPV